MWDSLLRNADNCIFRLHVFALCMCITQYDMSHALPVKVTNDHITSHLKSHYCTRTLHIPMCVSMCVVKKSTALMSRLLEWLTAIYCKSEARWQIEPSSWMLVANHPAIISVLRLTIQVWDCMELRFSLWGRLSQSHLLLFFKIVVLHLIPLSITSHYKDLNNKVETGTWLNWSTDL